MDVVQGKLARGCDGGALALGQAFGGGDAAIAGEGDGVVRVADDRAHDVEADACVWRRCNAPCYGFYGQVAGQFACDSGGENGEGGYASERENAYFLRGVVQGGDFGDEIGGIGEIDIGDGVFNGRAGYGVRIIAIVLEWARGIDDEVWFLRREVCGDVGAIKFEREECGSALGGGAKGFGFLQGTPRNKEC